MLDPRIPIDGMKRLLVSFALDVQLGIHIVFMSDQLLICVSDTVGEVVFKWFPNHRNPSMRSHIGEVILLLQVQNPVSSNKSPFYVPIPEKCTSPHKPEIETTQL